jgi:hypothetical protein
VSDDSEELADMTRQLGDGKSDLGAKGAPAYGCEIFFGHPTISVKKMNLECNLSTVGFWSVEFEYLI